MMREKDEEAQRIHVDSDLALKYELRAIWTAEQAEREVLDTKPLSSHHLPLISPYMS